MPILPTHPGKSRLPDIPGIGFEARRSASANWVDGIVGLRGHAQVYERLSITGLAVDGRDLKQMGLTPGPRFGEILRTLLERVIDDPDVGYWQSRKMTELARSVALACRCSPVLPATAR